MSLICHLVCHNIIFMIQYKKRLLGIRLITSPVYYYQLYGRPSSLILMFLNYDDEFLYGLDLTSWPNIREEEEWLLLLSWFLVTSVEEDKWGLDGRL